MALHFHRRIRASFVPFLSLALCCTVPATLAACSSDSGLDDGSPLEEEDYGIPGPFQDDSTLGKADSAGVAGPLVNTNTTDTQVWTARNKWEDKDTPAARAAGISWPENSGLNWDEKYVRWVEGMQRTRGADGYYDTFTLTTPYGKSMPAPKLECAELAMFLRIAFSSWYELPFYLTSTDTQGVRVYFGHFGARTKSLRYKNTPRYAQAYKDYSSMTAAQLAAQGWPKDTALRAKGLYGGGDEMDFVAPGAKAGAYFDEIFLNKRTGHFLTLTLAYFGSMHLASSHNTFNLKPQAVREGDVLLERWQRQGIGHTLVVKDVVALEGGKLEANLASGSMPRRQPKWEDGVASKRYFTLVETGGEGTNSQGDQYVKLGGGLKRWRVTKNMNGAWTNTWMASDEASWISDTDYERLKTRPAEFENLLGEVDPAQLREALLRMIEDARTHLRQYPASCSARIRREEAFDDLYELNETKFGVSRAQTDGAYRIVDDYAFAQLEYEKSKTCCWNSTNSAMYQIVMDYNQSLAENSCQEPVVFKNDGGYEVFKQFAEQTGRGHLWRDWSEDEPCAQRAVASDTEAQHGWIPWCQASQSGSTTPDCTDDSFEENDNPTQASTIVAGNYGSLMVCKSDDDYYKVVVPSGRTLSARIQFTHSEGDLDMTLYQGSSEVASSESTADQESVSASTAGTYIIRVYGYNGAQTSYSLTVLLN